MGQSLCAFQFTSTNVQFNEKLKKFVNEHGPDYQYLGQVR